VAQVQSEFAVKDKSHHSIKNENDIPLLSSVKEEFTLCPNNDDL